MHTKSNRRKLTVGVGMFACLAGLVSLPVVRVNVVAGDLAGAAHAQVALVPPVRLSSKHLPNLLVVHAKVISGGTPQGEAAFEELKRRGVQTIVSVDAVTPNADSAGKFGMRYVHLPLGYSGIAEDQQRRLGKAFSELPGIIYVHCHHGKHRGPTAAGVGCVVAGLIRPDRAIEVMQLAGTDERYTGLYSSARKAQVTNAQTLHELDADFREAEPVPTVATIMTSITETCEQIESTFDSIGEQDAALIERARHAAVMLEESFAELSRVDTDQARESAYVRLLKESESQASSIERLLGAHRRSTQDEWRIECAELIAQLRKNCTACHAKYRDAEPARPIASQQSLRIEAARDQ